MAVPQKKQANSSFDSMRVNWDGQQGNQMTDVVITHYASGEECQSDSPDQSTFFVDPIPPRSSVPADSGQTTECKATNHAYGRLS
jgi:hypothetical protein